MPCPFRGRFQQQPRLGDQTWKKLDELPSEGDPFRIASKPGNAPTIVFMALLRRISAVE